MQSPEVRMRRLSGAEVSELAKALASTLSDDNLEDYVHTSTGDRLYIEYVGKGKPLRPTIVDLINALEERGITAVFLRHVYARRSGREDVQELIERLYPQVLELAPERNIALSVQAAGSEQTDAPTNAFAPGLQRNVRPHLAKLDVRVWLEQLVKIERQVCRIEDPGGALGTGFLVGADTVLTNWHVIDKVKETGQLNTVGCRFDYIRQVDGTTNPGRLVPLHKDSCLTWSPCSASEMTTTPEAILPSKDQLDFALLRLASPVGQETVAGARRGWIALPKAPFPLPKGSPLLIVQHPDGAPMKLALDTNAVIGPNANGTRVRYETNTGEGSSGSPCFTMDWDIVALHHYGDPAWNNPLFNQGVPIELIRRHIQDEGLANTLGA